MRIERWHIEAMFALTKQAAPLECCGFITTSGVVIPIHNIRKDLHVYEMEPKQQLEAMKYSPLWAVYHSHVDTPSQPSLTDRALQRSGFDQIILSLSDETVSHFSPDWKPIEGWGFSE